MNPTPTVPAVASPRAGLLFALLEQSHDLMAVTDVDGRLIWANARFRDATGRDGAAGESLRDLIAPGAQAETTGKAITQALMSTPLIDVELHLRGVAAATLRVQGNARAEMGQVVWALREIQSGRAAARVDRLDQARISVWSHDIKTGRMTFEAHAAAILPVAVGPQGLSAEIGRAHV